MKQEMRAPLLSTPTLPFALQTHYEALISLPCLHVLLPHKVRDCDPPASPQILTTILTSAIGSCIVDGAWEQATDFLTDVRMAHGGALPPAAAFAAAANSCARAGQAIRAQALINELAGGSGERPTIECYNAVVAGCAIAGDLKGAVKILKETVPEAGLKADTRGVNHLISGCAKAGEWKMALTFLDEQRAGEKMMSGTRPIFSRMLGRGERGMWNCWKRNEGRQYCFFESVSIIQERCTHTLAARKIHRYRCDGF